MGFNMTYRMYERADKHRCEKSRKIIFCPFFYVKIGYCCLSVEWSYGIGCVSGAVAPKLLPSPKMSILQLVPFMSGYNMM